jgi:CheY-like chemotaxis protein
MTVLYAEDDLDDLDIFCEIVLTINAGISCISARNGTEALEILDSLADLPDYIFLDINMPTMDGKACLKNLKRDPRFKSIPVIIYTTSTNRMDMDLCRQLGATDYIIKPNTVKEAVDRLSKWLKI